MILNTEQNSNSILIFNNKGNVKFQVTQKSRMSPELPLRFNPAVKIM